jgi:hypothetical protein
MGSDITTRGKPQGLRTGREAAPAASLICWIYAAAGAWIVAQTSRRTIGGRPSSGAAYDLGEPRYDSSPPGFGLMKDGQNLDRVLGLVEQGHGRGLSGPHPEERKAPWTIGRQGQPDDLAVASGHEDTLELEPAADPEADAAVEGDDVIRHILRHHDNRKMEFSGARHPLIGGIPDAKRSRRQPARKNVLTLLSVQQPDGGWIHAGSASSGDSYEDRSLGGSG